MSYERWGTVHRGGEVKAIASPHEKFGIAYGWSVWTAIGVGNGGECTKHEDAMECLIHALDPDEGAAEK